MFISISRHIQWIFSIISCAKNEYLFLFFNHQFYNLFYMLHLIFPVNLTFSFNIHFFIRSHALNLHIYLKQISLHISLLFSYSSLPFIHNSTFLSRFVSIYIWISIFISGYLYLYLIISSYIWISLFISGYLYLYLDISIYFSLSLISGSLFRVCG